MASDNLVLKTAIGTYGHTRPIKEGRVASDRFGLEQVEISPLPQAFRMMVNDLTFDLSEMALTTHALAKAFNKPISGLPLVLHRDFHQGAIVVNTRARVHEPQDLVGRKVGVRAYSQTTGVWVRGILQDEYGLDHRAVTWVTFEGAHVREYEDAPNVVRAPSGKTLKGMLLEGEIDGAIVGTEPIDHPTVRPLLSDPEAAAAAWFAKTGVYPVNHIVVLKDELASAHPWLVGELFALFRAAKEVYLRQLEATGPASPEDETRLRLAKLVGGDPLPYGIGPNRKGIELLVRYAHEQKLLPRPFAVEELFHPATMNLE